MFVGLGPMISFHLTFVALVFAFGFWYLEPNGSFTWFDGAVCCGILLFDLASWRG
jgi:hypothetical protein